MTSPAQGTLKSEAFIMTECVRKTQGQIISDIPSKTHFKHGQITFQSKTKVMVYNVRLMFIVPLGIAGFYLILSINSKYCS